MLIQSWILSLFIQFNTFLNAGSKSLKKPNNLNIFKQNYHLHIDACTSMAMEALLTHNGGLFLLAHSASAFHWHVREVVSPVMPHIIHRPGGFWLFDYSWWYVVFISAGGPSFFCFWGYISPLAALILKSFRLLFFWPRAAASCQWRSHALLTAMSTIRQNMPRYHRWGFAGVWYRAIIISTKSSPPMWVLYSDRRLTEAQELTKVTVLLSAHLTIASFASLFTRKSKLPLPLRRRSQFCSMLQPVKRFLRMVPRLLMSMDSWKLSYQF